MCYNFISYNLPNLYIVTREGSPLIFLRGGCNDEWKVELLVAHLLNKNNNEHNIL